MVCAFVMSMVVCRGAQHLAVGKQTKNTQTKAKQQEKNPEPPKKPKQQTNHPFFLDL